MKRKGESLWLRSIDVAGKTIKKALEDSPPPMVVENREEREKVKRAAETVLEIESSSGGFTFTIDPKSSREKIFEQDANLSDLTQELIERKSGFFWKKKPPVVFVLAMIDSCPEIRDLEARLKINVPFLYRLAKPELNARTRCFAVLAVGGVTNREVNDPVTNALKMIEVPTSNVSPRG